MNSINLQCEYADNAVSNRIKEIRRSFGINHTGWHILKSINEKTGILKQELFALLKPHAAAALIHDMLIKYKIAGIIYDAEEKLMFTSNGSDLFCNCFAQQEIAIKNLLLSKGSSADQ